MLHFIKRIINFIAHRAFLIPFLLLLQLSLFTFIFIEFNEYFLRFYYLCEILSFVMAIHIVNRKANPGYKIAWIIPIMGFPLVGIVLYLFFGENSLSKKEQKDSKTIYYKQLKNFGKKDLVMEELRYENLNAYNEAKYIHDYSPSSVCKHTKITYLNIGEVYYEKLLEKLKTAKKYIFLEYFIISEGKMWDGILEILKEKAQNGVEVRLIYDDFGCLRTLPNKYDKKLQEYGIKTAIFNKLVPTMRSKINNRDHRKIAVIDGYTSFTGGINLADEYINEIVRFGHWKDNGIMMEGEASWNMTVIFLSMWDFITGEKEDYSIFKPDHDLIYETSSDGYIIPYCDSPWDNEAVGETVYLNLINKANKYIYITTPYLILSNEMLTALTMAAKRGVEIKIITPGIPDKKLVNDVTKAYYEDLISCGIKIYEYKDGFIHTKTFIVDDEYSTIGTINLDYRSLYLNFECGVWIYASHVVRIIKEDFMNVIDKSIEIKELKNKKWYERLKINILKIIAPLM